MSDNNIIVPKTILDTPASKAPAIHRSTCAAAPRKLYDSDSDNKMVMKSPDNVTGTKVVEKTAGKRAATITPNPTKEKKPPNPTKEDTWQKKEKKPPNSTKEGLQQSILSAKSSLLNTEKKTLTKAFSSVGAENKYLQGEIKKVRGNLDLFKKKYKITNEEAMKYKTRSKSDQVREHQDKIKDKDGKICCLGVISNKLQLQAESLNKKVLSLETWKSKKILNDNKEASKVRTMQMRHEMHMEKQKAEKQTMRELKQHASDL
eukprot:2369256-Ditylum_brightwellii.AAC.1